MGYLFLVITVTVAKLYESQQRKNLTEQICQLSSYLTNL